MGKAVNIFTGEVINLEHSAPQPVKEPAPIDLTPAELAAYIEYRDSCKEPTQNADGVHLGDIFRCSWGYEQTQVDFYQVVDLRGKHTAVVVVIGGTLTHGEGPMSEYRRAVRDSYAADAQRYTVRTRSDNGKYQYFHNPQIRSETCLPTDELHEHYVSWYY